MRPGLYRAAMKGDREGVFARLNEADAAQRLNLANRALLAAASRRRTQLVDDLCNYGADPDYRDGCQATPLLYAALLGATGMVIVLLRHGADPNVVCDSGDNAYNLAEARSHTEITDILGSLTADTDPRSREVRRASPERAEFCESIFHLYESLRP